MRHVVRLTLLAWAAAAMGASGQGPRGLAGGPSSDAQKISGPLMTLRILNSAVTDADAEARPGVIDPIAKARDAAPGPDSGLRPRRVDTATALSGDRIDYRAHCPVCARGLEPTVAILTRQTVDELGGVSAAGSAAGLHSLLKQLAGPAEKYAKQRFGVFAVFLSLDDAISKDDPQGDQRRKAVAAIKNIGASLGSKQISLNLAPYTIQKGGRGEPNPDLAKLTYKPGDGTVVVFYDRQKVVKRWAFPAGGAITPAAVAEIIKAIDTRIEADPR